MKLITRRLAILLSIVAFVASSAVAAELKIGVVDLHAVLQKSSKAKGFSQRLESQFKPRQQQLIASQKQLKADVDKIRRDATIMTADQRKALQTKITQEQQALEKSGTQYQKDLAAAQNKATQAFFGEVSKALEKVAKQGGYTMILQKENVPYSQPQMDVTQQVVVALG